MQIDIIVCKYECWFCAYFPRRFSHPDLWFQPEVCLGLCQWKPVDGKLEERWFQASVSSESSKVKELGSSELVCHTPIFTQRQTLIKACWTYVHIKKGCPRSHHHGFSRNSSSSSIYLSLHLREEKLREDKQNSCLRSQKQGSLRPEQRSMF